MASYQAFQFSAEPAAETFLKLKAALKKVCNDHTQTLSLMADDRRARIEFYREEYYFYLELIDEPWVVEESRDIARNHARRSESEILANCSYRVEFYGDDDANMDYFNDYFGLMEEFRRIPGVIIFNYPTNSFFGD